MNSNKDGAMIKPRALIADDVFEMRKLLKSSLQSLGFTVVAEAEDGADALEKIAEFQPDIVFLDIEMPGMSGIVVLDEIRLNELDVYPVIVSANSTIANIKSVFDKGAKGFIVKPYNIKKMKEMYNKYLETFTSPKAS